MALTPPQPFDSTDFDSPTSGNLSQTLPGQFDYSNIGITPTSLVGATTGIAYTQTVTISGGYAPYGNLYISAGTLPANITLSSTSQDYANDIATATISGTPTSATGNYTFTVTGNDTIGLTNYSVSQNYSLEVSHSNVQVSPSSSALTATVGNTYSQIFTATNTTGTITWSNIGNLPSGLALNSTTGNLAGIVTVPGNTTFTIVATDEFLDSGNNSYTLEASRPTVTISPTVLGNVVVGDPYSNTVSASGGYGTYTYSVTGGALPGNITLNTSTGVIAGTTYANSVGTSTFTITAYDSYNSPGEQSYSIGVTSPTITLAPTTISNVTVGTAFSNTVSASGGYGTYTYSVTSGALPGNVTLNSATGVISGTVYANAVGAPTFTVTAQDSYNTTGSQNYTINIASPTITVASSSIANGIVGNSYLANITATGGVAPYTWSGGVSLPPGLSLTGATAVGNIGTVTLTGIPTLTGDFNLQIVATDAYNSTGNSTYSVNIAYPTITVLPSSLSNATTGLFYQANITATGGVANYTYSITGNTLPNNLTLNSNTGVLSGIVIDDTGSPFTFDITAYDAYNSPSAPRSYSLVTTDPNIVISPSSLSNGVVGVSYTRVLSSQTSSGNNTGPYTYAVIDGALPANLTLSNAGVISGTPTNAEITTFTIESTDAYGSYGNRTYANIAITLPTITIIPNMLPSETVGNYYAQTVTALGGTPPYEYTITSGNLPVGVSLNSLTGNISGNVDVANIYDFTLTATDSYNTQGNAVYSIEILPPTITVLPETIANSIATIPYTTTFSAIGGTAPYTFTANNLPTGFSLNSSTGNLSGTPEESGYYPFSVTATDADGYPGTYHYNFEVLPLIPESAIRVYVGGILQTSGYSVALNSNGTIMNPATIEFDVAPPNGVEVGIVALQGNTWYDTTAYEASNGLPLQLSTNPAAEFLKGE